VRRTLVTGVTGQDGTILARRLVAEGHEVHGLVLDADAAEAWATAHELEAVTRHTVDLADPDAVCRVIADVAPAELYHLGGQSSVAASWADPLGTLAVTGLGAAAVFEGAHRLTEAGHPVRVVQASSAEIFGRAEQSPQDETTAIRPVSPYGAAKATAHHLAHVYRERGTFIACAILYNHESTLRPESFVTRKITAGVARIAHAGGGTLALGNLDAQRDWGWAPDYVDALVSATRHTEADDFVVATGQTHTVADFVRVAFAHAGIEDWRSHVTLDERFVRPAEASIQVGDASKARRVLGWAPTLTFEQIVGRMVDHDLAIIG